MKPLESPIEAHYDKAAELWLTAIKTKNEALVEVTERRMIALDQELAPYET